MSSWASVAKAWNRAYEDGQRAKGNSYDRLAILRRPRLSTDHKQESSKKPGRLPMSPSHVVADMEVYAFLETDPSVCNLIDAAIMPFSHAQCPMCELSMMQQRGELPILEGDTMIHRLIRGALQEFYSVPCLICKLRGMVAYSRQCSKEKVLIEAETEDERRHWDLEQVTPHTKRIGGRRFQGGLINLRQVTIRFRAAQKDTRNKRVSIQSCRWAELPANYQHQNTFSPAASLVIATRELHGRPVIQKWKRTQGKAKAWKRNTFLGHGGEIEGIPVSFLRRHAGFGSSCLAQRKRNCKHKRFELKLEYEAYRELDDVTGKLYDFDAENESCEWEPEDVKRPLTERIDSSLEGSHIPYEAYIGSVLGEQFQLGRLIREDEHRGEAAYQVIALLAPNKALEARSYCLTGLSREQLASMKRRIKRLYKKHGVSKIDQARKKFIVYYRNSPANTPNGEGESGRKLGAPTSTKDQMTFRISNYDSEFPALHETNSPQHTRIGVRSKERFWAFPDQPLSCEESVSESSARENHAAEEPKPPSSGQNPVVSSNVLDSCAARSPMWRGRRRRPRKSKAKVTQLASPGDTLHDNLAVFPPKSEIALQLGSLIAMHGQLNDIAQNIATLSDRLAEQHHLVQTARQFVEGRVARLSQIMDQHMALDEETLLFSELERTSTSCASIYQQLCAQVDRYNRLCPKPMEFYETSALMIGQRLRAQLFRHNRLYQMGAGADCT